LPEPFDLVIHDLGTMSVRELVLPHVLNLTNSHGLVVFDDIDHPKAGRYLPTVREICRGTGRRFLLARALTLDAYGRYAAIALPRQGAA
jgi:hypothetical protein